MLPACSAKVISSTVQSEIADCFGSLLSEIVFTTWVKPGAVRRAARTSAANDNFILRIFPGVLTFAQRMLKGLDPGLTSWKSEVNISVQIRTSNYVRIR